MVNNHSTVTCKILPSSGEALSHRVRDKGEVKRESIIYFRAIDEPGAY